MSSINTQRSMQSTHLTIKFVISTNATRHLVKVFLIPAKKVDFSQKPISRQQIILCKMANKIHKTRILQKRKNEWEIIKDMS